MMLQAGSLGLLLWERRITVMGGIGKYRRPDLALFIQRFLTFTLYYKKLFTPGYRRERGILIASESRFVFLKNNLLSLAMRT